MKPLGNNRGGYSGETIDIQEVSQATLSAAQGHGWQIEWLSAGADCPLPALQRPVTKPDKRIYLSTGIHGDEPAGPLAIQQLLQDNRWPENAHLWVCPCLNPTGFPLNKRENAQGADLNRDYRHLRTDEIQAHVAWLNRQPNFDITLCLHEDWEAAGFYLYELNPDNQDSLAQTIIRQVAPLCPIELSDLIENRPAQGGIIAPRFNPSGRPEWPEAFYLTEYKTRLSYTLESPSDFPMATRIAVLVAAVRAALGA